MKCQKCGATDELMPITAYDWNSTDDDALSIKRVIGHQCTNATGCARRVVAQGTNTQALHGIMNDRDNLPADVVSGARDALGVLAIVAGESVRANEMLLRESGFGVIGGPRDG